MLSIILNIIGLIFILFGIVVISKDLSKNKRDVDELNIVKEKVKEYYKLTEGTIENFYEVIEEKMDEINLGETKNLDNQINQSKKEIKIFANNHLDANNNLDQLHNKVLQLYELGLNGEEIAKKLNKSKREIEIILRIYNDKKVGKTK